MLDKYAKLLAEARVLSKLEVFDMPEKCPHCGKEFANSRALGSHIHYVHDNIDMEQSRSDEERERFQKLFGSCLTDRGLRRPRRVEKVERAIVEIPEGVSAALDQYREAYKCAVGKEKLLREIEEELRREEEAGETG